MTRVRRAAQILCALLAVLGFGILSDGGVSLADLDATYTLTDATLTALAANDWSTLYTLSDPDMAASVSRAEYVARMTSAGLPHFTDAYVNGPAHDQRLGTVTLVAQPIGLRAQAPDGSIELYSATLQLAGDQDTWYLYSITTPVRDTVRQ